MGTRNLTCVFSKGKYRVSQYCQWDGYPKGQGCSALAFLLSLTSETRLMEFTRKVDACHFLTDDEVEACWSSMATHGSLVTMDEGERFKTSYPELHRDTGAEILPLILNSSAGLALHDDLEFAADSLFCEWAYVIDLDAKRFEVYQGFNKTPLGPADRFASFKPSPDEVDPYHPVRLVASWPLAELPSTEAFLATFAKLEGEDAA